MQRTISIRITTTSLDKQALLELGNAYVNACNRISPIAHKQRCWNRVALYKGVYRGSKEFTSGFPDGVQYDLFCM